MRPLSGGMRRFLTAFLLTAMVGSAAAWVVLVIARTALERPYRAAVRLAEDSFFAMRFHHEARNRVANDSIVIVDIDWRSLRELGSAVHLWPRRHFAGVVDNLTRDGASVVFLDILFEEGWNFRDNQILTEAVARAGNVITGYHLTSIAEKRGEGLLSAGSADSYLPQPAEDYGGEGIDFIELDRIALSYRDVVRASVGVGYTNYLPGPDGILRHIPLLARYQGWIIPAASLEVFLKYTGVPLDSVRVSSRGLVVGDVSIPTDSHSLMRVNYRDAHNGYRHVSFCDVLDGTFEEGAFTGRVVLVGSSAPELGDIKKIPGFASMPGVMVHAAAIRSLMERDVLQEMGFRWVLFAAMVAGALATMAAHHAHGRWALGLGMVAGVSIMYGGSLLLFLRCSVLLNPTLPLVTFLAGFPLGRLWRSMEQRDRKTG